MYNRKLASTSSAAAELVKKVRESAPKARQYGRDRAAAHYSRATGASRKDADLFYDRVRTAFADCKVVLNLSPVVLARLLSNGQISAVETQGDSFNMQAQKRAQVERAIGCVGLSPIYASVTQNVEGDRGYGPCSVVLSGLGESAVLVSGDSARLRNPAREDFVSDPSCVLYSVEDIADCRAASAIRAMPDSVLLRGPDRAIEDVSSGVKEYGRSEALVFGGVHSSDVSSIVTDSEASAIPVRQLLARVGKLAPVVVCQGPLFTYGASSDDYVEPPKPSARQLHFSSGDRVTMKPGPSNPVKLGTIMDVSDGMVTIQWDNSSDRTMYDMAEALMRVMAAPEEAKRVDGMVAYSLPGMDDEAVLALSAAGIDPVSLYSIASHLRPVSSAVGDDWKDNLVRSLSSMGLNARGVSGFVRNKGTMSRAAFLPGRWFEARLPGGSRLVMDLSPDGIRIAAGEAEDYVLPAPDAFVKFE